MRATIVGRSISESSKCAANAVWHVASTHENASGPPCKHGHMMSNKAQTRKRRYYFMYKDSVRIRIRIRVEEVLLYATRRAAHRLLLPQLCEHLKMRLFVDVVCRAIKQRDGA